jgi:predicted MPP superfamily phosphohydrolase
MYAFAIFKLLYALLNISLVAWLYVALRGTDISRAARLGVCVVVAALALTFPVARGIDEDGFWVRALTFVGSFWLSLVLHGVLAWLLLWVFRVLNRRLHWIVIAPERRARWRLLGCAGIAGVALLVSAAGWLNTQYLVVREVKLAAPIRAPLRIVALSDTHLGRLASPDFFAKVVDQIEPLAPDIVLFAGDILEYDYDPSDAQATAAVLHRLKPRLGIWGVLGNHEYIGGRVELSRKLLDQIGIRILIDEWAEVESAPGDRILLIGRDDRSGERFSARERATIDEITVDAFGEESIRILLDHQPFNLQAAEEAGVYLQISGHTHNGQLFPFNWLVAAIYENAYGYSTRGKTHYWVTSGAGTWGPRVRTTGRTEILLIDLVPQGISRALP